MDYDALAHDHSSICFHLFGRIVLFSIFVCVLHWVGVSFVWLVGVFYFLSLAGRLVFWVGSA